MNARNYEKLTWNERVLQRLKHTYIVFGCDVFDKWHDFKSCLRVQTWCWFIEKDYLWAGDELTGHCNSSLLPSADSFTNWSSDKCIRLLLQSKSGEESLDTSDTIGFGDGTVYIVRKSCRDLTIGWTYDDSANFAAKYNVSFTVSAPRKASSCST